MRILAGLTFTLLVGGVIGDAFGQTIDLTGADKKGPLPMYRPILLGTGLQSLTNRIDVQGLIQKGQKDAAIMFTCTVSKTGVIAWSGTYRGTPDSKPLEEELMKLLAPAGNLKMIPAIYNHQPVEAIYYGTVTFTVVDGKPRLRIFSNQETAELEKETDFISPQPFFGSDSKFDGLHYPSNDQAPVKVDGVAEIKIKVDASGSPQDIEIVKEEPGFSGFGNAAVTDFSKAKFIPAFRDGKAVEATVTVPVYYKAPRF
jgi:TonB family protein